MIATDSLSDRCSHRNRPGSDAQPHMNPLDDPGPLLPIVGVDLIDKTPPRFTLILEADLHVVLGLGDDFDCPKINSPLSRMMG